MKICNNDVRPDFAPTVLRTIPGRKNLAGQPPLVQPKKRTVLQQKTRADQHEQIESRKEAQNRVHAAHPGTAAAICRYRPNWFHCRTLHRSRRSLIAFLTQAIRPSLLANNLQLTKTKLPTFLGFMERKTLH